MAKVKLHVGKCKEALAQGVNNLSRSLSDGKHLTPAQKIKYAEAMVHMNLCRIILAKIKCDQPEMSIEIPPPPPSPSARTVRRARRSNRRGR